MENRSTMACDKDISNVKRTHLFIEEDGFLVDLKAMDKWEDLTRIQVSASQEILDKYDTALSNHGTSLNIQLAIEWNNQSKPSIFYDGYVTSTNRINEVVVLVRKLIEGTQGYSNIYNSLVRDGIIEIPKEENRFARLFSLIEED